MGRKDMSLKLRMFALFYLSLISNSIYAFGDEYFCTIADVKKSICKKGDLLYVPSPQVALRFCDFSEKVVSFSRGDASDIDAIAICHFYGKERERRK